MASGIGVYDLTRQRLRGQVVSSFWWAVLSILAVTFALFPQGWSCVLWRKHHFLTECVQSQEADVCICVFMLGEMSPLMSLVCFSVFVCFDLIWFRRTIFPRSSPFPLQQTYPHIFLARIQKHTDPEAITVRGEMDCHDWFKICLLPEAGGEAHFLTFSDKQDGLLLEEEVGMAGGWALNSACHTWALPLAGPWR